MVSIFISLSLSPSPHMCRNRKDTLASDPSPPPPPTTTTVLSSSSASTPASAPRRPSSHRRTSPQQTAAIQHATSSSSSLLSSSSSSSFPPPTITTNNAAASSSSFSSAAALSTLRLSLPHNPVLYPFNELAASTNNFLAKRLSSSSSSCWRCTLRTKDVVVFQRSYRGADPLNLPSRLSALCKSHHSSLIKLLGASLSADHIYLVYDYVPGATLHECLRNPRNPNFTPLSKWYSRMQVATDLAEGLHYIHHHCNTIHNRIKSSSVLVTEPNFNAKICHFGAADLAGEVPNQEEEKIAEEEEEEEEEQYHEDISTDTGAPSSVTTASPKAAWRRSDSGRMKIEGTRGYIAPEVIAGGKISYRSDVFAFGVVILELLSGREPLKYTMNRETKEYERLSLIDTARDAIGTEDEDGASEIEAEERKGRIRRWVDRRLKDSFPVEVAEKLTRLALRCVEDEPFMRPDMMSVAGKVSKLFLESKSWDEAVRVPADFSVSLAPR